MVKILRLEVITSIKAGIASTIQPDGTIINPEPYVATNVYFEGGEVVQIERPLTKAKVMNAFLQLKPKTVDEVTEGEIIS